MLTSSSIRPHSRGYRRCQTWSQYYGYHVAFCDKHDARIFSPVGTDVGGNVNEWILPVVDDFDLHGGTARLSFAEVNTDCNTYPRSSVSLADVEHEFDDLEPSTEYEEQARQRVLREVDDSPLHS